MVAPDIAGWRTDTVTESELDVIRVSIAPDWVCETLSGSTEPYDRDEKSIIYAANGVGHLWFVNPVARRIEAKRNERGRWLDVGVFERDASARIEPFDVLELELSKLWMR